VNARLVAGALRVGSSWIDSAEQWQRVGELAAGSPEIDTAGLFPGDRIQRADRVTQLGAVVLARAVADLAPCETEGFGVITASMLATAHTNERFERRRVEQRPPEPRVFPYTAPNAAGGEFSIALGARGPSLALVGGPEVGLVAVERACAWLARGDAARVVVVATECVPPTWSTVAPSGIVPVECAAALVLDRADRSLGGLVRARWLAVDDVGANPALEEPADPTLSVGPLAALVVAARTGLAARVRVRPRVGSAIEVVLDPR